MHLFPRTALFGLLVAGLTLAPHPACAADRPGVTITRRPFGTMPDGTTVDQFVLANAHGLRVTVVPYGAMIATVETPDRNGKTAFITLHRDTLAEYLAGHPLFGSVVGRYANRIGGGRFTIDGVAYRVTLNAGRNHIHGGKKGFHQYVWKAAPLESPSAVGVRMSHESLDGDEGFPGRLSATVTYSLTADDQLKMEYTATSDKPTHVNLTNHAYWNLAGAGSGDVLGHELWVDADRVLAVDDELIPRGPLLDVRGTPLDFTAPKAVGARIDRLKGGYDHCYVLNRRPGAGVALAARVVEPGSGRVMEVYTTQPGVQLYTANGMMMKDAAGRVRYGNHAGLCLETQHYPDAPNHPEFPSTLLRPGETYREVTVHRFRVLRE